VLEIEKPSSTLRERWLYGSGLEEADPNTAIQSVSFRRFEAGAAAAAYQPRVCCKMQPDGCPGHCPQLLHILRDSRHAKPRSKQRAGHVEGKNRRKKRGEKRIVLRKSTGGKVDWSRRIADCSAADFHTRVQDVDQVCTCAENFSQVWVLR
jgi:hypothetical protein